jgi:hypothetical protein
MGCTVFQLKSRTAIWNYKGQMAFVPKKACCLSKTKKKRKKSQKKKLKKKKKGKKKWGSVRPHLKEKERKEGPRDPSSERRKKKKKKKKGKGKREIRFFIEK